MALDTTKLITAVNYNGNPIPLAGITPSGKITITDNGTDIDVSQYALADVNVSGGDTPLPSGYTRLKYIESSGTQYIDTGIVAQEGLQIEIATIVNGSGFQNIAGVGSVILLQTSNGSLYNVYFGGALQTSTMFSFTEVNDFLCIVNQDGIITRGYLRERAVKTWTRATIATGVESIWLFASDSHGSPSRPATMQCYEFRVLVNGTKVCDLIPAMRDSDSVIGMYDIVQNVFRENLGTGVFTGGEL